MGKVCRVALALSLLTIIGCAVDEAIEVDTESDAEQVVLVYSDFGIEHHNGIGIMDGDFVDPGPCGCGDDYACMQSWAEYNFACGVCISVVCDEGNANVCTSLCGPGTLHGQFIEPRVSE